MPALPSISEFQTATATEQVFQAFYSAIITLDLPPGTKLSEVEAAKSLGVSRQPVRDAFYRLSELGFLRIRPQRATTITFISEQALKDARFIRTALEVECVRVAAEQATREDIETLDHLVEQQTTALANGERLVFHELDDQFHRAITDIAGHPNAWNLIRDQKVHLDRVRYLSLSFGAQSALDGHLKILDGIKQNNPGSAEAHLRDHLSQILNILQQVRKSHSEYFVD